MERRYLFIGLALALVFALITLYVMTLAAALGNL